MHARIENGVVAEYPIVNLRQRIPEVSLPVDLTNDEVLPAGFVHVRSLPAPEFDPTTQTLAAFSPRLENGKWVAGYEVVPLAGEELEQAVARKGMEVRSERDRLLSESDWTQLADAPVDQQAWAAYRQALRDVTSQDGFPHNVSWPVKPS